MQSCQPEERRMALFCLMIFYDYLAASGQENVLANKMVFGMSFNAAKVLFVDLSLGVCYAGIKLFGHFLVQSNNLNFDPVLRLAAATILVLINVEHHVAGSANTSTRVIHPEKYHDNQVYIYQSN